VEVGRVFLQFLRVAMRLRRAKNLEIMELSKLRFCNYSSTFSRDFITLAI